eukprot:TRINITY_DN4074_c0_g1_i5.p1 TRINITY_DN4074_c0_g1~~TRINITY_DN4074_c0_g1_i5.p1  ORF type:complete len:250 (-),score=41.29 TRINITY_DN4074_c0_g1_i5:141-806(-)
MLYSLGHEAYESGAPITRPLLMEFGADPKAVTIHDQWLVGTGLMTAPVLSPGGSRSVYFPALGGSQRWFEFGSATTHDSGISEDVHVALDSSPVYARSGTIVPLGPVVQHTGELPGDGKLEVQVYAGADGSFILVEDDGDTFDYEHGSVRRIAFQWSDATQTLSWTPSSSSGLSRHRSMFTKLVVTLFFSTNGKVGQKQSPVKSLDVQDKYTFDIGVVMVV